MFALSWFYLYGLGVLFYGGGAYLAVALGVLDLKDPRERRAFWTTTAWLGAFCAAHALFQFVLPFWTPPPEAAAMDTSTAVELTTLDSFLVVTYFLVVFGFGSYFGKYVKSTADFFFSGRKFAWWLIAFSMIATVVGSYSFIKYSATGYRYGLSSSMSYLNDWFFMPLWLFGWLPILYFTRLKSIPEYFERRFDTPTRFLAILFIAAYLVGYIGINFYTLGVAINALFPSVGVFEASLIICVVTAIYVTSGGQTAVIMTDLLQGILLLLAGLGVFVLGLSYIGDGDALAGVLRFWKALPEEHRYGLAHFNREPNFSFIGVFWQDAVASTFAAYFFNQGILMRFLALRSVHHGRKAMITALAILMPLAVLSVGNAGWIGAAMRELSLFPAGYPQDPDPNRIFVLVTHILSRPGVFGLVMAALLAALMSSADTLINASSAVVVNDIIKPYLAKNRPDSTYLRMARYASIAAAAIGVSLVPVFQQYGSIYVAHGRFVAMVTPPMAMTVLLGFTWKRYTARAAFLTLLGGGIAMVLAGFWPELVAPFAHGVDGREGFHYMRALYGLVVSGVIGVVATFLTRHSRSEEEMVGYTMSTIRAAEERFKGGPVNREIGGSLRAELREIDDSEDPVVREVQGLGEQPPVEISLHPDDLAVLRARPGDLLFVEDERRWLGGLRAAHVRVRDDRGERGVVSMPRSAIVANSLLLDRPVRVEKMM